MSTNKAKSNSRAWDTAQGWTELGDRLTTKLEELKHIVGGPQNYGKYLMTEEVLEMMEEIEAEGWKKTSQRTSQPQSSQQASQQNSSQQNSTAVSARYQIPCPVCGASPGHPCRTLKTNQITDAHMARVDHQFDKPTRVAGQAASKPAGQSASQSAGQETRQNTRQNTLHEALLARPIVTMTADKLGTPDRTVHGTGYYRGGPELAYRYEVVRYAKSKKYWVEYLGGPRHPITLSQGIALTQEPLLDQPGGVAFDLAWKQATQTDQAGQTGQAGQSTDQSTEQAS